MREDLSGRRFGRLVVLEYSHTDKNRFLLWRCKCDCGKETISYGNGLRSGDSKSCGCARHETNRLRGGGNFRHGQAKVSGKTSTYISWSAAKNRCNNPLNAEYNRYGGRGIEMRFKSVVDLISDIGEKPDSPVRLSLDRIDNEGHYEPGNVRWATPKQQANNRRSLSSLIDDDVRQIRKRRAEGETARSLGEEYGISRQAITHICTFRTWQHVV